MLIQLTWQELESTRREQKRVLETPVAMGRVLNAMPEVIDGIPVSRVVLNDNQIAGYHALIVESNRQLLIVDQNTSTGTLVNGLSFPSCTVVDSDEISIGIYTITIRLGANISNTADQGCDRMVGFLFKRRCGRTQSQGCSYCRGGVSDQDPYLSDRSYYPGYGEYDDWRRTYYYQNDSALYNRGTNEVDFTDSDAATFEDESDRDFEQNFGAS